VHEADGRAAGNRFGLCRAGGVSCEVFGVKWLVMDGWDIESCNACGSTGANRLTSDSAVGNHRKYPMSGSPSAHARVRGGRPRGM